MYYTFNEYEKKGKIFLNFNYFLEPKIIFYFSLQVFAIEYNFSFTLKDNCESVIILLNT